MQAMQATVTEAGRVDIRRGRTRLCIDPTAGQLVQAARGRYALKLYRGLGWGRRAAKPQARAFWNDLTADEAKILASLGISESIQGKAKLETWKRGEFQVTLSDTAGECSWVIGHVRGPWGLHSENPGGERCYQGSWLTLLATGYFLTAGKAPAMRCLASEIDAQFPQVSACPSLDAWKALPDEIKRGVRELIDKAKSR